MPAPEDRPCAEPGCAEPGEFRAPLSNRGRAGWKYLCLDHVRAFNAAYSYQEDGRAAAAPGWERRTRAFAANAAGAAASAYAGGFDDPIGVMKARMGGFAPPPGRGGEAMDKADTAALAVLGLDETARFADVRARYKERVRALHPDSNGGDRRHEAELRRVIDAYTQLRNSPVFKGADRNGKS